MGAGAVEQSTILGGGWASAGFSASSIDAAHRGVGFLLHEGGQPVRLRTFYLADDDLGRLARRAEELRAAHANTAKLPPPGERQADHPKGQGCGSTVVRALPRFPCPRCRPAGPGRQLGRPPTGLRTRRERTSTSSCPSGIGSLRRTADWLPRGRRAGPPSRLQPRTGVAAMVVPARPRSPGTLPGVVMLALALLATLGAGPATAAPNSGRAPL
jgi:hypothetical protein